MPHFLAEVYITREDAGMVEEHARRARLAAQELTAEGLLTRYLNPILVPADETCFHLYEAVSAEAVREAALRAGLRLDHVAEVAERPLSERSTNARP
jgi:hypothetical protein